MSEGVVSMDGNGPHETSGWLVWSAMPAVMVFGYLGPEGGSMKVMESKRKPSSGLVLADALTARALAGSRPHRNGVPGRHLG